MRNPRALFIVSFMLVLGCNPVRDRFPDTEAIKTIQIIHVSEMQFLKEHGRYGKLEELKMGKTRTGAERTALPHEGYRYSVVLSKGGYIVRAWPTDSGVGLRSFCSDQSGAIREYRGQDRPDCNSPGREVR